MIKLIIFIFLLIQTTLANIYQEDFSSAVIVEVKRFEKFFTCSGVIISPDVVLTAAHCLDGEVHRVRVFHQSEFSPRKSFWAVKDYHIHPEYNRETSKFYADIAKINLENPVQQKIYYPTLYSKKALKGNIIRAGFGSRNGENKLTIVPLELKKYSHKNKTYVFVDLDSKSGDSGGPIFVQNGVELSLLAIHSTLSFGPEGKFSYNPRVSSFDCFPKFKTYKCKHHQAWSLESPY